MAYQNTYITLCNYKSTLPLIKMEKTSLNCFICIFLWQSILFISSLTGIIFTKNSYLFEAWSLYSIFFLSLFPIILTWYDLFLIFIIYLGHFIFETNKEALVPKFLLCKVFIMDEDIFVKRTILKKLQILLVVQIRKKQKITHSKSNWSETALEILKSKILAILRAIKY